MDGSNIRSFFFLIGVSITVPIIISSTFVSPFYWQCYLPDVGQAMSALILLMCQVSSQVQWLPFMFWPSQTVVSILTMGLSITI